MKIFDASYFKQVAGYGVYDDGSGFVVANTQSEALGLCLESHPKTKAEFWSFEEISLNEVGEYVCISNVGQ